MTRFLVLRFVAALLVATLPAFPCRAQGAGAVGAPLPAVSGDESDRAAALEKAGDAKLELGELTEARASFENAVTIRRRLAAADTRSSASQINVIVLLTKIG